MVLILHTDKVSSLYRLRKLRTKFYRPPTKEVNRQTYLKYLSKALLLETKQMFQSNFQKLNRENHHFPQQTQMK